MSLGPESHFTIADPPVYYQIPCLPIPVHRAVYARGRCPSHRILSLFSFSLLRIYLFKHDFQESLGPPSSVYGGYCAQTR